MSADENHLERRASQRFDFQLPIAVRLAGTDCEGYGFTQDLSGRGVFFYTDFQVTEGDAVELTLVMPSEITLTENRGFAAGEEWSGLTPVEQKFGVAARLEGYEYLPKAESAAQVSANFPRISTVHASLSRAESVQRCRQPRNRSLTPRLPSSHPSSATARFEVSGLAASRWNNRKATRLGNR